jgi:hypothetical protein
MEDMSMGQGDGSRYNPYPVIEEFWGETLDKDLIHKIESAPKDHIKAFQEAVRESDLSDPQPYHLPDLPAGHIRPVLNYNADDELTSPTGRPPHGLSLLTLLYAHQIVVDYPMLLFFGDEVKFLEEVKWLAQIKPLFQEGAVHFKNVASPKRHPSRSQIARDDQLIDSVLATRDPAIMSFIAEYQAAFIDAGQGVEDLDRTLCYLLLNDTIAHYWQKHRWTGEVHKLIRNEAEQSLLGGVIEATKSYVDTRELTLNTLIDLPMPNFEFDVSNLVAVRRSSSTFEEWRGDLGGALHRLQSLPARSYEDPQDLAANLRGELEPAMRKIGETTRKSSALAALRTGTKSFGIAAAGATVGFAAGGSLASALASAAAAKAMEGIASYFKDREEKRTGKAVIELVASLTNGPPR